MSDFKPSLDEYTEIEKSVNGNMMYGGKRHDEICDYLQSTFKLSESQINDASIGVWMAIDAEKKVWESINKNAIRMIEHHITACGGNNHGSLIAAIKMLKREP
jgi:hypothetical protein